MVKACKLHHHRVFLGCYTYSKHYCWLRAQTLGLYLIAVCFVLGGKELTTSTGPQTGVTM